MPRPKKPVSSFRYFNSSPEIIRLVVMMFVRFPLSLRNVEDLLAERGIDICHEMVRFWWNRFGPLFAANERCQRVHRMRGLRLKNSVRMATTYSCAMISPPTARKRSVSLPASSQKNASFGVSVAMPHSNSEGHKSQSDKFKELACELKADEDGARWDERLRRLAKAKPEKPE